MTKLTFLLLLFVMAMILHVGCSHIEFGDEPDYEFSHEAQEDFEFEKILDEAEKETDFQQRIIEKSEVGKEVDKKGGVKNGTR